MLTFDLCFHTVQASSKRHLHLLPSSPDVGNATKHLDVSVARHNFPRHLISSEALQAIKERRGWYTIVLPEPRTRWSSSARASVLGGNQEHGVQPTQAFGICRDHSMPLKSAITACKRLFSFKEEEYDEMVVNGLTSYPARRKFHFAEHLKSETDAGI
jgi:hypothetical protein